MYRTGGPSTSFVEWPDKVQYPFHVNCEHSCYPDLAVDVCGKRTLWTDNMSRLRGDRKKTMIPLAIRNKVALHNCYMPFIRNGGLFVENRTGYELGDDVLILLDLLDETEKIPIAGKVVWIAGKGVKNPHSAGVGIQFSDPDKVLKDRIETHLVGLPGSSSQTATM